MRARVASHRPAVPSSSYLYERNRDKSGTAAGTAKVTVSRQVFAPLAGLAERMWTWRDVQARVADAFDTFLRLPTPKGARPSTKMISSMEPVPEGLALIEMIGLRSKVRPALPSPQAISQADEAMGWLLWIDDLYLRKLVAMRGAGASWPMIMRRLQWSERKLREDHRGALIQLAARLNNSR